MVVIFGGVIPIYTVHFRGFWKLEGTPSFVALGRVIICDLNFKRIENHNFTITTNPSQHLEFFHSLIFFTGPVGGIAPSVLHQIRHCKKKTSSTFILLVDLLGINLITSSVIVVKGFA